MPLDSDSSVRLESGELSSLFELKKRQLKHHYLGGKKEKLATMSIFLSEAAQRVNKIQISV